MHMALVFVIYVHIGTVRYIGKLDFDILDLVYIGVHLDTPGKCLCA